MPSFSTTASTASTRLCLTTVLLLAITTSQVAAANSYFTVFCGITGLTNSPTCSLVNGPSNSNPNPTNTSSGVPATGWLPTTAFSWGLGNSAVLGSGAGRVSILPASLTFPAVVPAAIYKQALTGAHFQKLFVVEAKLSGTTWSYVTVITYTDCVLQNAQITTGSASLGSSVSVACANICIQKAPILNPPTPVCLSASALL